MLNEYDDTKRILNVLRNFKNPSKSNLTERRHYYGEQDDLNGNESFNNNQEQQDDETGVDNVNDVDIKLISSDQHDMTLTDEQKTMISSLIDSFREQVSQTADLDPGFTFNVDEIRLDGVIPDEDLKFTYITGENSGLYINAQMLTVTQETMDLLTKMLNYNKQITDSMELILRQRQNN
ncbi:MAG: hypothetical protein WC755_07805 [Candidatus Woesearchaeota archaeon]